MSTFKTGEYPVRTTSSTEINTTRAAFLLMSQNHNAAAPVLAPALLAPLGEALWRTATALVTHMPLRHDERVKNFGDLLRRPLGSFWPQTQREDKKTRPCQVL